jgi:ABC-type spermidine/putrescine transport system permease subunit II
LLVASAQLGINRGLATLVTGHMVFVLAVAYRLVLTRLQALPPSLIEASFDLGASRWQTLRYVLLPHLTSAVVTGAMLSLTLSFDETLISTFVAGDQMTLPLRLWAMMRVGFTPEINALVTLVLLVSIVLSIVTALRLRPKGELEED